MHMLENTVTIYGLSFLWNKFELATAAASITAEGTLKGERVVEGHLLWGS